MRLLRKGIKDIFFCISIFYVTNVTVCDIIKMI